MHCNAGAPNKVISGIQCKAYLEYRMASCGQLWKFPTQIVSILEKIGLILLIELIPAPGCVQV